MKEIKETVCPVSKQLYAECDGPSTPLWRDVGVVIGFLTGATIIVLNVMRRIKAAGI